MQKGGEICGLFCAACEENGAEGVAELQQARSSKET
jgi:hypothetical protein